MGYGVGIHNHPKLMTGFVYVHFLFIGLLSIDVVTKLVARGWKLCVTDIWYWLDLFNVIVSPVHYYQTVDLQMQISDCRLGNVY